ncbi:carbohydrate kinase [Clostridiaceae bacterium HSG29]|nr:carbohydrate kinase [Clostridiaceae bacterium HSG29]
MRVVSYGEALIDFTPKSSDNKLNGMDIETFEANPGGAPANLAAVLGKYNIKSSFIGKVGYDKFGDTLINTLNSFNVDTSNVIKDKYYNTTLAFVHLNEQNDRSFSFFRNNGADTRITLEDVDLNVFNDAKIFHFGSLSFTDEPIRSTTIDLLDYVENKNLLISYDPNLRDKLWLRLDEAKWWILKGMEYADIVKVSEEELEFLTNKADIQIAAEELFEQFELKLLIVTLGEKGSFYKTNKKTGIVDGVKATVVDTTGAGDIFYGSFLYKLINNKENIELTKDMDFNSLAIDEMLSFANTAGALSVTKKGAMTSIPNIEDIK